MPTRKGHTQSQDSGFVLPIIIIVGLILGAGIMALSARTFSSLMGSIRQGQSREAREAAESGLAIILKELNRHHPYLLIENCEVTATSGTPDCSGWRQASNGGSFVFRTSICPNALTPPERILSKLTGDINNGRGRYRLLNYTFSGDQHQGGVARIKVQGQHLVHGGGSTKVRATAYVEQELSVLPKNCDVAVNTPATESGFPGLLSETVNLGNNDVYGDVNGNVLCTTCSPNLSQSELAAAMQIQRNGYVSGNLFGGQIAMPQPPVYPSSLPAATPIDIDGNRTLEANSTNGGACQIDTTTNVTHCRIRSIDLSGKKSLKVISGQTLPNGQKSNGIRLYFASSDSEVGNPVIRLSGGANISHYDASKGAACSNPPEGQEAGCIGSPGDLGLFGLARSTASECSQSVILGGGSVSTAAFIFFPDGCVGINGGSANPDIRGAVWARTFQGSNSNNAEVDVPANMGSILFTRFGTSYGLGIREFAALGINRWLSVQLP